MEPEAETSLPSTEAEPEAETSLPFTGQEPVQDTELRKKLQKYFDAYPGVVAFHVTSDGQTFIDTQWAREHQKTLGPGKEFKTVNR